MFRLKKLDIQGFKSFAERTSLTLPTRVTAIVGPNGSGKSNICDAVQWVLGEQSARALRGSTMEDVIFNGSARRRPLGMAEVSLTLEARGGAQWVETGGEVVITRRVTRDGESDYILNGKKARLKDVQDLLLGTGLGVRAYSIIEQQKIDLILSTKPQDRRRLIEEASGISKYKVRKRQAEVKLEETRANLLRLTDLVSEVERTCTSLKRQASRAARWKEHAGELSARRRRLLRLRHDHLAEALAAADEALAAATAAEVAATAEAGARDAAFEESRRIADEVERLRREKGDDLARSREALLAAEGSSTAAVREAEETLARVELLEAQRREAEEDHFRSVEQAERADRVRMEVEEELATAEAAAGATAEALAGATRREQELSARREAARRELLLSTGRAAETAHREREAALLADRLGFALGKLAERKARAADDLAQRDAARAEAEATQREAAALLEEARKRLESVGVDRRAADAKLTELKAELENSRQLFHALDRRIASLETTLSVREAGGEAARRALEGAGLARSAVLADHFEVTEGFEPALDAALGSALEAPVVPSRDDLTRALDAVRRGRLGTARFVHPIPDTPFPLRPLDPRVLGVARDFLKALTGDEGLSTALPDAVVTGSVEDALALAALHPERTIVSKDGVVVRGSVVEAAGTEVPGEGLFTVRRDLKNLLGERQELSERIAALEDSISGTAVKATELATDQDGALSGCRRAERAHSESAARLAAATSERRRAEQEHFVLGEEESALTSELERAGQQRAEATEASAQRAAEVAAVERTLTQLEAGDPEVRAARITAAEADAAARTARDLLKERRRGAADTFATHRGRADGAARRLSELAEQLVALAARREDALTRGEAFRAAAAEAAARVALAETARSDADRSAEETRTRVDGADRDGHAAREALDTARRLRFEAEILVERRRADRAHIDETSNAEFGCAPGDLPPLEVSEGGDAPDEAALAEEVQRLTVALEKLGPVNYAALEEFEVESKRLQEMSTQKLDLEKSLEQILDTIATINETSAARFLEAFSAVNANFNQVFQRLFRGGQASMALLDESDLLDTGIEILAQPPGKRNQTIGLLSGGEKALTAVALLVAIFRYRPSPFCIMDEVDAPLDDANIDRFTSLLAELSEETQFVLITHSKRTMESAQALYGVTQEEPGVSKLVSVRFD